MITHSAKVTSQQKECGGRGGWIKFEKKGKRESNIGGLHKIGGLGTLCRLFEGVVRKNKSTNLKP